MIPKRGREKKAFLAGLPRCGGLGKVSGRNRDQGHPSGSERLGEKKGRAKRSGRGKRGGKRLLLGAKLSSKKGAENQKEAVNSKKRGLS